MMRRTLANMASFYTEQQSVDVREGLQRRIQEGWFVGKAPYGYRNIQKNGRGIVEIDPEAGPHVRRIFELFAYHPRRSQRGLLAIAQHPPGSQRQPLGSAKPAM